jgi:hypothetical protein
LALPPFSPALEAVRKVLDFATEGGERGLRRSI